MQTYTYHEDGRHGWLQVSIEELFQLGVLDQITGYSYYLNGFAYLEEDQDMGVFLSAKFDLPEDMLQYSEEQKTTVRTFWDSSVNRSYHDNSRVRNFPSFNSKVLENFKRSLPANEQLSMF